jgi:type II secretory pathway component PulK
MKRTPRGHVAGLVLVVAAALVTLSYAFSTRLSVDWNGRSAGQARQQALWLARSAVTSGVAGRQVVKTAFGDATVTVKKAGARVVATAELPRGGRAAVTSGPGEWTERFDR